MPRARTSLRRPVAFAAILAGTLPCGRDLRADPPRSILQPAGELAAADRESPASGVVTSRAPDVLRDQLSLRPGAGLVVDAVAPGSAAERAGLKRHDVLVALDDQLLVLPEQFAALAAAAAPGAPLNLEVRRAGGVIAIALGGPPATPPTAPPTTSQTAPPAAVTALPATTAATPLPAPPPPATRAQPLPPPPGARRVGPDAVVLEDRDCRLKVYRDGDTRLSVRDARGWLVFNGPIATPAQRSLIPRRVRDRVERLEVMLDSVEVVEEGNTEPAPPIGPPETRPTVVSAPPAAASPATASPATAPAKTPEVPVAEVGSLDVEPIEIR